MFLIKIEEDGTPVGNPIALDNFKQLNPELSLPFPLLPEHIEQHGYGIYDFSMPPSFGHYEKLEEVAPVKSPDNGVYYQTYVIVPMSKDECVAAIEAQWVIVRQDRNHRLMLCDWTQIPDCQLSQDKVSEWAIYRQELRDITDQQNPFEISWPVPPT